jgi:heptosyltransferase-2
VRGVNWLGDAVMTTPALLRLREKYPNAHIALLCPDKLKDLWLHHPAVDEVIPFAANEGVFSVARKLRRWGECPHEPPSKEKASQTTARGDARPTSFDLALVLPNSPRSALEVFLARIPQRIGYARPWRNFSLTNTVPSRAEAVKMHKRSPEEVKRLISQPPTAKQQPPASAHQTNEYLHLVAALGANPEPLAPQLAVTLEEIEAAKRKFGLENITGPVFGLNPGAEYGPAKRWPVESFIRAAHEIQRRSNCAWILFGGKNDATATVQIESAIRNPQSAIFNLAGQTSLRELMALLKLCRVLLTNDTGPMHVAAALGTPVVVPFGSTSPELTGPGLPGDSRHQLIKSDAPCSPCFLRECPIDFRCMNGITVERVVEAVLATQPR